MTGPATKPTLQPRAAGLRVAFRRLAPPVLLGVVPIAVLALAAAAAIHQGNVGVDFRGELYPEAKLVLHGHNPFPPPGSDLAGGVNRIFPVPAALLVVPLTVLPAGAAADVFVVILLVALMATLAVLGVRDWRIYGVVAMWPSSIAALQTGNLTILLGLLVAIAWRTCGQKVPSDNLSQAPEPSQPSRTSGRFGLTDKLSQSRLGRFVPGIAIGLAIALKLFLWPLVVWLLAIRRFGAAAVAIAISVAGTLLVLPFTSLRDYAHLMSRLGDTFGRESYNPVGLLIQSGIAGHTAAQFTAYVIGIAILALAFRERSLPLAIAASFVLSPIVWLHYLVLLVIPLAIRGRRFGLLWLLPLALWTCPGNGGEVRLHDIVLGLVALAVVTAFSERAWRRTRDAELPIDSLRLSTSS